jgi:hypothetical protein
MHKFRARRKSVDAMEDFYMMSGEDSSLFRSRSPTSSWPALGGGSTIEEIRRDKKRIQSYEKQLERGHLGMVVREVRATRGITCASCACSVSVSDFPLLQGYCRHTICKTCYGTHVRLGIPEDGDPTDCPVDACGHSGSFRVPWRNNLAMHAVNHVTEMERAANSELGIMHLSWQRHVDLLEKCHPSDRVLTERVEELEALLERKDQVLDEIKLTYKKQVGEMQERLGNLYAESREDYAEKTKMLKIIKFLENGKEYYYLKCPKCGIHLEKVPRNKITAEGLPLVATSANVCETLEVEDAVALENLTMRSQMGSTKGFKNMRKHLMEVCIPMEVNGVARESEMPVFYRKEATKTRLGTKNTFTVTRANSLKRRRVSD